MTLPLFHQGPLESAIEALRTDLLADGGPRISTMRNYRFAIVPYEPADETQLRNRMKKLTDELKSLGWLILSISLQKLLLDRVRSLGDDAVKSLIAAEKRQHGKSPERGLAHLQEQILPLIEGPDGIAADVVKLVQDFATAHPSRVDHSLVLLGRLGALYPFFRSSALLRHIDGRTSGVPVILLYPGTRVGRHALRFMGEHAADGDYRPKIYP
ncbi:MAG: DUF1788 domain-containing protein [Myxococcales bacterium]|nr:DUF1788 domain-containing protein [Myxococcales bacterium]